MPAISAFFGIRIYMYYDDHNPPHFHAIYNNFEALIDIDNLSILKGELPSRAMGLVIEWAYLHKDELINNWNKAVNLEQLNPIPPLK